MSLLDVALFIKAGPLTEYMMTGTPPVRSCNMAPLGSPAEVFLARDGSLIVSAYFPNQWPDLCRLLDLETLLSDPRFTDNARRIEHRAVLHPILQDKIARYSSSELKERFAPTRITAPCPYSW